MDVLTYVPYICRIKVGSLAFWTGLQRILSTDFNFGLQNCEGWGGVCSNSKDDNTVSFLKRKLLYTFCCNTGLPVEKSNFIKIGFRIILKITALIAVMVGAYITAEKYTIEPYTSKAQELPLWKEIILGRWCKPRLA